jgi:NAD(P)-dependent dehydrogenase (short-subunit alcohol dehydrogenase family)
VAQGERTVLVTGAAGGIGRASVQGLARVGFRVIAGVRNEAAGRALAADAGPAVSCVTLDLTRPDQIARAAEAVRAATGDVGLYGLVNNAGIVVAGPAEFLPLDALREQLEVNVVGLLGLTQALLPALRQARGRIVNVSSVNGRLATSFTGAYAASKFALEALSDALRRELDGAVDVIVIQPGAFKTGIWDSSRERARTLVQAYPPDAHRYYGRVLARLGDARAPDRAGDPARVARAVARALTARRPRARYVVGIDARIGLLLAALLPTRWLDRLLAARRRIGSTPR